MTENVYRQYQAVNHIHMHDLIVAQGSAFYLYDLLMQFDTESERMKHTLMKWLVCECGADVNVVYEQDKPLLWFTIKYGLVRDARVLIELGASARFLKIDIKNWNVERELQWVLIEHGGARMPGFGVYHQRVNTMHAALLTYALARRARGASKDVARLVAQHVWRTRNCSVWDWEPIAPAMAREVLWWMKWMLTLVLLWFIVMTWLEVHGK